MDDRDIFIIEVSRRGRDGNYTGASEVAALKLRADALEARPNITEIDAIPNVTAPSPTNGQVLLWNGTAWVPGAISGSVARVDDHTSTQVEPDVNRLTFHLGLTASRSGSGWAAVSVRYGGTGTAVTAARSDHAHNNPAPTRATFGPQAYMSSGTRRLQSTNVTLASGISYVVKARLNMQMRGADPGACYYQLRLTINGNARTSIGGQNGFWCVQGVPDKTTWEHHITMTGTGAAITISADAIYFGGGGFYTDAGEIVVEPVPNR